MVVFNDEDMRISYKLVGFNFSILIDASFYSLNRQDKYSIQSQPSLRVGKPVVIRQIVG